MAKDERRLSECMEYVLVNFTANLKTLNHILVHQYGLFGKFLSRSRTLADLCTASNLVRKCQCRVTPIQEEEGVLPYSLLWLLVPIYNKDGDCDKDVFNCSRRPTQ